MEHGETLDIAEGCYELVRSMKSELTHIVSSWWTGDPGCFQFAICTNRYAFAVRGFGG